MQKLDGEKIVNAVLNETERNDIKKKLYADEFHT